MGCIEDKRWNVVGKSAVDAARRAVHSGTGAPVLTAVARKIRIAPFDGFAEAIGFAVPFPPAVTQVIGPATAHGPVTFRSVTDGVDDISSGVLDFDRLAIVRQCARPI